MKADFVTPDQCIFCDAEATRRELTVWASGSRIEIAEYGCGQKAKASGSAEPQWDASCTRIYGAMLKLKAQHNAVKEAMQSA